MVSQIGLSHVFQCHAVIYIMSAFLFVLPLQCSRPLSIIAITTSYYTVLACIYSAFAQGCQHTAKAHLGVQEILFYWPHTNTIMLHLQSDVDPLWEPNFGHNTGEHCHFFYIYIFFIFSNPAIWTVPQIPA